MGRKWSELITDMLEEIDIHLFYIDKVRVRAVCLSWNSSLVRLPNHGLPQLPWLLQTIVDSEGERSHGLFNIREKKSYQIDLPQIRGRFLKGSSHGWLVMLSMEGHMKSVDSSICLINPLTGIRIQLPPRYKFPDVLKYTKDKPGFEYRINSRRSNDPEEDYVGHGGDTVRSECHVLMNATNKIITSAIPTSEDCVIVAIYGEFFRLAWCRPGQKEWTPLYIYSGTAQLQIGHRAIEDIIFSRGKLYVVNCNGTLFEVDNIGPNAKVKLIVDNPLQDFDALFLVESSDGSLIMINISAEHDTMDIFEAYKLDRDNSCWRLVKNIGDDMVFMGYNQTFSLPARQFPGFKGNCIYFTDNPLLSECLFLRDRDSDIGVYNLEDGSVERISGFPIVPRTLWPQPVWVMPPTNK